MKISQTIAVLLILFVALFFSASGAHCAQAAAVGAEKESIEKNNAGKPDDVKTEAVNKKADEKNTSKKGEAKTDKKANEETKVLSQAEEEEAVRRKLADPKSPLLKMILIEGGCFEMGDFTGEGQEDERPVHKVCLSSYYLGEAEVTQELFTMIVGSNPSVIADMKSPVTDFTYTMLDVFLFRLNKLTKKKYRLPTEAEWEFAARERGKNIRWSGTNDEEKIGDYAWFSENSGGAVHNVRKKKPNALGFYDMTGNVYEIVQDNLDLDYYKRSPKIDPLQTRSSIYKVARGGAFTGSSENNRSTFRYYFEMDLKFGSIGFRLAL